MKRSRSRFALLAAGAVVASVAASCEGTSAVMRDGTNAGLAGLEDQAERVPTVHDGVTAGGRAAAYDIGAR